MNGPLGDYASAARCDGIGVLRSTAAAGRRSRTARSTSTSPSSPRPRPTPSATPTASTARPPAAPLDFALADSHVRRPRHRGHRQPRAVPLRALADPGQQRGLRRRASIGSATRPRSSPARPRSPRAPTACSIAELTARVRARDAGIMRDGFSFQAGAGGTALAFAIYLQEMMKQAGVQGALRARRLDEVPGRDARGGADRLHPRRPDLRPRRRALHAREPAPRGHQPLHLLQLPRQGQLRLARGRRRARRHRGGRHFQRQRGDALRRPACCTASAAGRTASSRSARSSPSRRSATASR